MPTEQEDFTNEDVVLIQDSSWISNLRGQEVEIFGLESEVGKKFLNGAAGCKLTGIRNGGYADKPSIRWQVDCTSINKGYKML